jgi:hypothetical protein
VTGIDKTAMDSVQNDCACDAGDKYASMPIGIKVGLSSVRNAGAPIQKSGLSVGKLIKTRPASYPLITQTVLNNGAPVVDGQPGRGGQSFLSIASQAPDGPIFAKLDVIPADEQALGCTMHYGAELVRAVPVRHAADDRGLILEVHLSGLIEGYGAEQSLCTDVYQFEPVARHACDPVVRANPQGTVRRLGEAHDLGIRQTFGMAEGAETPAVIAEQPVIGSDPEKACVILKEAPDIQIAEAIRRAVLSEKLPLRRQVCGRGQQGYRPDAYESQVAGQDHRQMP